MLRSASAFRREAAGEGAETSIVVESLQATYMSVIHILNVADFAFMAAGLGVAFLMIAVSARDERRNGEEQAARSSKPGRRARP